MPKKCHPFSPNLARHLFEKDASCPGTGQAAILDLQDQLRGPRHIHQLEENVCVYEPLLDSEHVVLVAGRQS